MHLSNRYMFRQYLAQTSMFPLELEIDKAEGVFLYDTDGKEYIDFISGIAVSNVGHRHPLVLKAIRKQLKKYMHLMVYGEYIQSPQVLLAKMLIEQLPAGFGSVYFVNSGSEAIEGAMKLAKRFTGRTEMIAFKNAYHGSTAGALSIMGNEVLKMPFRPLLPGVSFLDYDNTDQLSRISGQTACVIAESIQGEAGVIIPQRNFLKALRRRCDETGTLLILDEIQTGFGRTGSLFAFQQYGIMPDVITVAKGMGGGLPLGAFISSKTLMECLADHPPLSHITTFGGNPVCCAAALETLRIIISEKLAEQALEKEKIIRKYLLHPNIKNIRGNGLLLALELNQKSDMKKIITYCLNKGLILDNFLFNENCIRIAPPLTILPKEIKKACKIILKSLDQH